ncbi:MAG: HNH endonuclease signature motif containing protein [Methylocella sp.]
MHGDLAIIALIECGRLRVDAEAGHVYAPKSNNPDKPIGCLTKKGYLRACVSVGGKQMHFMVHRIVWVSVHGPLPEGHQVDHGVAGKAVNRITNLDAVTGTENMSRAARDGKFAHVGRRDGIRDIAGRFGKKTVSRHLAAKESAS